MPTLGGGIAHWNNIDDSLWQHGRIKVADLSLDSPSHEPGVVIDYIYCPTPKDIEPKGTILLIHGFPQTSYQFRRVITPIAKRGYDVLVPNYRGAGGSSKPWNGYTKKEMAADLHSLVEKLGVKGKVHVVGHDLGHSQRGLGRMSFARKQGLQQGQEEHVPLALTFHSVPDLPEALIQGKERLYLKHFYDRLAQNPDAISAYDLDVYTNAYSMPGAMRAGLNVYRTFEQDAADNRRLLEEKGKCQVPCLTLWAEVTFPDSDMAVEMAGEFYEEYRFGSIRGSGHWIAEEKPGEFVNALISWLDEQNTT